MNISEQLEIIIPTYNRAKTLMETIDRILNSPVSKCKITILDNNSKDDTERCVKELLPKYENLIYIKNRYNLGLAGNICKALTIPEKKYFWIVFDDTGLDFSNWQFVEEGLKQDYDCILTTNYYDVRNTDDYKEKAAIYLMLIFCFAGIYKTDLITDDVVLYALTDIYTVHSQMALISAVFNDKKRKIFIPEKTVTYPKMNPEQKNGQKYSFNRSGKSFYHFRISHGDFIPGFMQAIQSIKDNKLKEACADLLFENRNGYGPYGSVAKRQFLLATSQFNKDYYINLSDEYLLMENKYRIKKNLLKEMLKIEKTKDIFKIILFNKVKIRLWKAKRIG